MIVVLLGLIYFTERNALQLGPSGCKLSNTVQSFREKNPTEQMQHGFFIHSSDWNLGCFDVFTIVDGAVVIQDYRSFSYADCISFDIFPEVGQPDHTPNPFSVSLAVSKLAIITYAPRGNVNAVSICISLTIREPEHFFTCVFAI